MKHSGILLFILLLLSACKSNSELSEAELVEKAKAIHEEVITLDTHCDINVNNFTDSLNYTMETESQVNLPNMISGGLDVAYFIVYTGQDSLNAAGYAAAYDNAMSKFDAIHRLCEEYAPDQIELATTSEEVRRIQSEGKKVAMIGVENGYPIGLDISNVKKFHDLGATYISLSHNGHSQLCDSNTGEAEDDWLHNGVSEFGKEVIKEMNKWGIMIDISHPSKESIMQMFELSKAPIIASHSSARHLCDHSRNLDNEQLMALKKNGGVVQTVAFKAYVNTEKYDARQEAERNILEELLTAKGEKLLEREEMMALPSEERTAYYMMLRGMSDEVKAKLDSSEDAPPRVDVSDFVDHIDYMVDLIGLDHVGISSDFDGGGGIEGWDDASETFNVTLELVRRGYTQKQIDQLWSGNLLRVLDEVQAVAKKLQIQAG